LKFNFQLKLHFAYELRVDVSQDSLTSVILQTKMVFQS